MGSLPVQGVIGQLDEASVGLSQSSLGLILERGFGFGVPLRERDAAPLEQRDEVGSELSE